MEYMKGLLAGAWYAHVPVGRFRDLAQRRKIMNELSNYNCFSESVQ